MFPYVCVSLHKCYNLSSMKYFIYTLGCQMNLADTEAIAAYLRHIGMKPVDKKNKADVIVLNTCTVRRKVELKAFSYIGWLSPLKENNPKLKIIVTGCVAQLMGEKLKKKFPIIDLVVGAKDIERFPAFFNTTFGYPEETVSDFYHPHPVQSSVSAFVTIMRGCDNFCSYCIVPHVRGRESSLPVEDILSRVRTLAQSGVKDVTLIGQNVNSYAASTCDGTITDFSDLLRLVSTAEGIQRIRFTTSHPKDLSDKLIKTMAVTDKVCKHIHLPLQSGSDRILKAMKRNYTAGNYLKMVTKLRVAMPDISMTTDIIVGFPGETEEDFQQTVVLVKAIGFNSLFAFKYSPREGTASFAFQDDVPLKKKEERLEIILAVAEKISIKKNARHMDMVQEVLVEKKKSRFCTARTDTNIKVYFFTDNPEIIVGKFVHVKIKECRITTLVGEVNSQIQSPL